VAEAAEAVAEVEQEAALVHHSLAQQGGLLAEQAREHAERLRTGGGGAGRGAALWARPTATTEPALGLLGIERLGWSLNAPGMALLDARWGRLDLGRGPAHVVLGFDAAPVMFGCRQSSLSLAAGAAWPGVVDSSELTEGGQAG
jgi:hypothetical protein